MKNLIQKDKKRRNLSYVYEANRFILKNIIKNKNLTTTIRWNAAIKLSILPNNSSKVKQSNRCINTGRKKGIVSMFKLSRISFLKLARSGMISGLRKFYW